MKKIAIIGSTGYIGRQALEVVGANKKYFELIFISCHKNIELIKKQKIVHSPKYIVATGIKKNHRDKSLYFGWDSIKYLIEREHIDLLVVAASGIDCIHTILYAIEKKINIATANKETIVLAGNIIMELANINNINFIPIDSEHSGVFQCLQGNKKEHIRDITITASGGPFLDKQRDELKDITLKDALKHPVWPMGNTITIDSATMMNKALELIELHYLFNIPADQLSTIIHPQAIIHSFINFIDGSTIAQLSVPDMRVPITYALTYPNRILTNYTLLDLAEVGNLTFRKPDYKRFPILGKVKDIIKSNYNSYTIALLTANELAVNAFLDEKIPFLTIEYIVEDTLETIKPLKLKSIDDILSYRDYIKNKINNKIEEYKK